MLLFLVRFGSLLSYIINMYFSFFLVRVIKVVGFDFVSYFFYSFRCGGVIFVFEVKVLFELIKV